MFRSPLFTWSPRPDPDPEAIPASQTPSRFSAFRLPHTIIHGSSVYSQSPSLENEATPKVPFLGLSQRQSSPDPNALPTFHQVPPDSSESRSPLHAQTLAGSYIGAIAFRRDPQEPEVVYNHYPADNHSSFQQDSHAELQVQESTEATGQRRHHKKHRRRKHTRRNKQFVRRKNEHGSSIVSTSVHATAARRKMLACVISGIFLVTILAIYLAIALTNRDLGQEIHIVFIMILLAITIFFCHSLVRLCMLLLNAPRRQRRRPHIPSMISPNGFQPTFPIRVHLARDEEAGNINEVTDSNPEMHDPEKEILPPPPPAYGLWRSSVRANPDLLHWQRAEHQYASPISTMPHSRFTSMIGTPVPSATRASTQPETECGPRPPSYVSEDGVSYIIESAPRSMLDRESRSGISDIHPAWRPGYAISAITPNERPIW